MTTYTTFKKMIGKLELTIIIATGDSTYVLVGKKTTTFLPAYKGFVSIEKAIKNFKDIKIKLFLELVSIGIISPAFEPTNTI